MVSTTYSEFNDKTEALKVASAFTENIRGKTVLVTGVNKDGLGFSAAEAFASQSPAKLVITGRNPEKLNICIAALKASYPSVDCRPLVLDLSTQKTVRAAAAEFNSWADVPDLDIMVNSAGVSGLPVRTINEDGIEMHFATNHVGHWLFANLVLPKMTKAAERGPKGATRIVNISAASVMASGMRWSDMNFEKRNKDLPEAEQLPYRMLQMWGHTNPEEASYIPVDAYSRSKVANVLFAVGATKRWFERYGILSLGVHPGVIRTELVRNFVPETLKAIEDMMTAGVYTLKSLGAGSSTGLVAALDPKLAEGVGESVNGRENYGAFLLDCQPCDKAHPLAVSSDEAERLWKYSEKLVGEEFN